MLSLLDASKRTGKTKPTLLKAIKRGRLSASKDDGGQWRIDPAELFRVYPPVNDTGTPEPPTVSGREAVELEALKRERGLLQEQVDDLRRRLDASEQERREVSRQLTALLTDQREKPPRKATEGRWRRAWSILRGRS